MGLCVLLCFSKITTATNFPKGNYKVEFSETPIWIGRELDTFGSDALIFLVVDVYHVFKWGWWNAATWMKNILYSMLNGGYLNTMTRAIIYLLMDEMQGSKDVWQG